MSGKECAATGEFLSKPVGRKMELDSASVHA